MENTKLKELTEKIYNEGLEKGRIEAENLIKNAQEQANKMISDAKLASETLMASTQNEVAVLRKNVENELKMSVKHTTNAIKQSILNLISSKLFEQPVEMFLKEPEFLKKLIQTTLENWNFEANEGAVIKVSADFEQELNKYLTQQLPNLLSKGVEIQVDKRIKSGFRIGPKDNKYIISFSEQDFNNFFKQYTTPRIQSYLFDENE